MPVKTVVQAPSRFRRHLHVTCVQLGSISQQRAGPAACYVTRTPGQHQGPLAPASALVEMASKATASSASAATGGSVCARAQKICVITRRPATATGAATGRARAGIACRAGEEICAQSVNQISMVMTATSFAMHQKLAAITVAARRTAASVNASKDGLVIFVTRMRPGISALLLCQSNASGTHHAAAQDAVLQMVDASVAKSMLETHVVCVRKACWATTATFCARLKQIAHPTESAHTLGSANAQLPMLETHAMHAKQGHMMASVKAPVIAIPPAPSMDDAVETVRVNVTPRGKELRVRMRQTWVLTCIVAIMDYQSCARGGFAAAAMGDVEATARVVAAATGLGPPAIRVPLDHSRVSANSTAQLSPVLQLVQRQVLPGSRGCL